MRAQLRGAHGGDNDTEMVSLSDPSLVCGAAAVYGVGLAFQLSHGLDTVSRIAVNDGMARRANEDVYGH